MPEITDPSVLGAFGGLQPRSGPIYGAPDPYKQAAEARASSDQDMQRVTNGLQNQLTQLSIEEKQRNAAEDAEKKAAASKGDEYARAKLLRVIAKLTSIDADANDNGGWFETGASGSFSRKVLPDGTAGYDLGEDIKTLQANFAFDALQAMRDASKTGGALGAVSERELDLLQSATANINPNLSHETFRNNLEDARQVYLSKLAMIDPQAASRFGYDASRAEKSLLALNGGPLVVDRREGVQSVEPVPDDIAAIMAKYGSR